MTVYNITKVINKTLLNSIKRYMNADKIMILYTDWGNHFGIRIFKNTDKEKAKIVSRLLWDKLCKEPITKFTEYPKVDTHNASLIRQYGRTYKR